MGIRTEYVLGLGFYGLLSYPFTMGTKHESTRISYSTDTSLNARSELFEEFKNYPATPEEAERSLGLFLRGSLLARIFGIREAYEQIVQLPGLVLDIGTWRGQTAVVCENLRAIFEPLHLNRRIVCFDTFTGYQGFSDKDKPTSIHKDGTYTLTGGYEDILKNLLMLHEQNNAMGHFSGKHTVIKGDCRTTLPQFFSENKNEFVALAFFDVNSVEPTKEALHTVWDRLVPGGILAVWQLTRNTIPAEGIVYVSEVLGHLPHEIKRSQFYPGLCLIKKK